MIPRRATVTSAVVLALVATLLGGPAGPAAAAPKPPSDCSATASFAHARFPRSPDVDNRWFPLEPGTRFDMRGTVVEDGVTHRHRIVTTVTRLTKVLDGVRTVVVLDEDYDNGSLQESELAFMAEDSRGRVWNVGEYPEEYQGGKLDGAPSTWISGIAGAAAGIGMPARPHLGDRAYLQGAAPSVGFRDCAQVVRTGQRVCVPAGCYRHVLVVEEWAPLEPAGGEQLKYYAPGVGNVQVTAVGGAAQESLRLAVVRRLHGSALAAVDALALKQDRRGYHVSPDVYGRTQKAVLRHR